MIYICLRKHRLIFDTSSGKGSSKIDFHPHQLILSVREGRWSQQNSFNCDLGTKILLRVYSCFLGKCLMVNMLLPSCLYFDNLNYSYDDVGLGRELKS